MASVNSALLTNQMLEHWQPNAVLMVGVAATAGSEAKQNLGDIVIAREIAYYERGKITAEGKEPEPKQVPVDATLLDRVQALLKSDFPISVDRPDGLKIRPQIEVGVIASGDNVIADAATRDQIAATNRKILAIEMEGYGVIEAVRQQLNPTRCLVIRSLCDYADNTKNDLWKSYAAAAAAGFTKYFLLDEPLAPLNKSGSSENRNESIKDLEIKLKDYQEKIRLTKIAIKVFERDLSGIFPSEDQRRYLQYQLIIKQEHLQSLESDVCTIQANLKKSKVGCK